MAAAMLEAKERVYIGVTGTAATASATDAAIDNFIAQVGGGQVSFTGNYYDVSLSLGMEMGWAQTQPSFGSFSYTIALLFARAGARAILHGRALADAQAACERIRAGVPAADVHAVNFALGDADAIDAAFADLEQRGLAPDILVNNAAHLGLGADTTFLGQTPEFFREVIDANLVGTFRCSQLAAREMRARGKGGAIVNVTSLAGERCIWGRSAYCTSKAALEGLTRAMSLELAQDGIRVNCISAGYIWTPRWDGLAPEHVERRHKNTPCRAPTQQEEIARLALFLASGQAPSLIGSRVVIDGGLNAQQVPSDATV